MQIFMILLKNLTIIGKIKIMREEKDIRHSEGGNGLWSQGFIQAAMLN